MRYAFVKYRFADELLGPLMYYASLSQVQTIIGITSKVGRKHILFWDIEYPFRKATLILRQIQSEYKLSNIYINSDKEGSYHAWCFSLVSFETMLKILIDSKKILDWGFFVWTVRRRAATLRLSKKKDRPFQKVVKVLESYYVEPPRKVRKVTYTTGTEKFPQKIFVKK